MMPAHERWKILGIDLGTTYSSVAEWNGRGPVPVEFLSGTKSIPSVVSYDPKTGAATVGRAAKHQMALHPENGVIGVKRLMATDSLIQVAGMEKTPSQVSSDILRRLIADVLERTPGSEVSASVVTVPYHFRANQCDRTRQAAELANANCRGILQEPIAAALDYALTASALDRSETMLVFDLGGGTFDLTVFQTHASRKRLKFEVLATGGDDQLGGLDFDQALVDLVVKSSGFKIADQNALAHKDYLRRLWELANEVKHTLSATNRCDVAVAFGDVPTPEFVISRGDFERAIEGYLESIEAIVLQTLTVANVKPADLSRTIRVGGSSKIPAMGSMLERIVGRDRVWCSPEMDLTVSRGACLYAAYLDDHEVLGREVEIITRTSHALGVLVTDKRTGSLSIYTLISANTQSPCTRTQTFTFDPREPSQTHFELEVHQGRGTRLEDNQRIGKIEVNHVTAGDIIEVSFAIDLEQVLTVTVHANGRQVVESFTFT